MTDINKILFLPEGKTLEFKQDLSSLKPILKTLIAFANTAGGTLIIGRTDKGKVIGVENIFVAEEQLTSAIADNIYPPLMPEIEISTFKGCSLLIVQVPFWRGPFYLKSKGEEQGTYIRLGSSSRLAGPEMLAELKRAVMKTSFDQQPCPDIDVSGLNMKKIKETFAKVGKKIQQKTLETLGILVPFHKKLVCSNGGLILFGKDELRKQYFPNAEVRCARFQGSTKTQFIDQLDIQGSVLDATIEVPKFIQRNTRLAASIEGARRKDIPEYSPIVIREILTNALVHANYSILGMNPKIAIFSDRLEIESPGMLPYGYTLENFFSGVSHVRNKVIVRVFRELNLMEEWGTGYKRIEETCQKDNYPLPAWNEIGNTLRVSLTPHSASQEKKTSPTPPSQIELSIRQEKIISLFAKSDSLSLKEIHKKLKSLGSERTFRNDLQELKEKNLVVMVGRGPATRWKLKS